MVAPSYLPRIGGVERHIYFVHNCLKTRGIVGSVLVLNEDSRIENSRDGDVMRLSLGPLGRHVRKLERFVRMIQVGRYMLRYRNCIFHFHDYRGLYPVLPLLYFLGSRGPKTFITFHGWEGVFPVRRNTMIRRQQCAKVVDGIISVGKFISKWYNTPPGEICYGGVDVKRYSSATIDYRKLPMRIAYLGRLEKDTGVLDLLEAVQRVSDTGLKIELHIFGTGSLESKLRNSTAACPQYSVVFHSAVDDTFSIVNEFPVICASGYLTILEALCARRLVLAFYNNPLREDYLRLHPAEASMFICGSADDFDAALDQIRSQPDLVSQRAELGWKWAQAQSWESVADLYVQLWKS